VKINKILERLQYLGMVILLIGLILKINDMPQAFYVYGIGAIPILILRIYNVVTGSSENYENYRKNVILVISSIFLASAAVVMYLDLSWWIVPITIAAAVDLYMSFRVK